LISVGDGPGVTVSVWVGSTVAEAVCVGEAVGVIHPNGVGVAVTVGVRVAVAVGDGPGVLVRVGNAVSVQVADGVRVGERVRVAVKPTGVALGDGPSVGVGVGVRAGTDNTTATGTDWLAELLHGDTMHPSALSPLPSWPYSFSPQHQAPPA
jgi:hypothetical protein